MKIRGNLVGTTQKPEKVLVKATDLTEEQKAQARENIAACHKDDSRIGTDVWSSKNTIDKLCPSFTESGSVVTCEPLEGYPLEVTASAGATQIVRCGKNLFDFKQGVSELNWIDSDGKERNYFGLAIRLPAGTYTLHAEKGIQASNDYIYGVIIKPAVGQGLVLVQGANTNNTYTVTLEQGDVIYIYDGYKRTIATANDLFARNMMQIEAGTVATAYEPYCGETFDVGVKIPALAGTNYLYADAGNITVTGRLDPDKPAGEAVRGQIGSVMEKQNAQSFGFAHSFYFEVGSLVVQTGLETYRDTAVRSSFIRMRSGNSLLFVGDLSTFAGIRVFVYDESFQFLSQTGNSYITEYTATQDCYVRVLCKYVDGRNITDASIFYNFIDIIDKSTICFTPYSFYWTYGTFSISSGNEMSANNRVRSNFIRMNRGDKLTFIGDTVEMPGFNVAIFDTSVNFVSCKNAYVSEYVTTDECYVRLLTKYTDNRNITDLSPFYNVVKKEETGTPATTEKKYQITGDYTSYYTAPESEALGSTLTNSTVDYIYNRYDALMADNPSYIQKRVIGYATNTDGTPNQDLPIYEYEVKVDAPADGRTVNDVPTILMTSGMHGDEKSSVYATLQFFEELFNSDHDVLMSIRSNFNFKVIPIVNPYGYNANTRRNARNVDINRNFSNGWASVSSSEYKGETAYSEQESQVVRDWLLENKDALIFIDNHNMPDYSGYYPCVSYFDTQTDTLKNLYCSLIRRLSFKWRKKYFPERIGEVLGYSVSSVKPMAFNEAFHVMGMPNTCILEIKNCDENHNFYTKAVIETGLEQLVNFVASFIDNIKG